MVQREWDAVVIGGGFFGAYLSLLLSERLGSVLLIEREQDLMLRASYNNQARVHGGYHYPRSLMTAVRSRINFPRFVADFPDCISNSFPKYYAIASILSKVTAEQFRLFMDRVGASLTPAPESISRLFNPDLIEEIFTVREFAFDAAALRRVLQERLAARHVPVELGMHARTVTPNDSGGLEIECDQAGERVSLRAKWVFNCTYSALNGLRHRSGLPLIPLKHEIAEIALVEPPPKLGGISVTVMCGPFFSLMPFPDRRLWTLSHVRYTPHQSWQDTPGGEYRNPYPQLGAYPRQTHGPLMIRDSARYLPAISECQQRDSLWEVKTILPQTETDDGRPILFHRDPQLPGLISVLGGKLDNIYDLPQELDGLGLVQDSRYA